MFLSNYRLSNKRNENEWNHSNKCLSKYHLVSSTIRSILWNKNKFLFDVSSTTNTPKTQQMADACVQKGSFIFVQVAIKLPRIVKWCELKCSIKRIIQIVKTKWKQTKSVKMKFIDHIVNVHGIFFYFIF